MKHNEILQDCWIWNDSVTEFVKSKIKGYSLNVCAGKNPIADVNIDLDPKDKSILKGDMRKLKFEDNTFDTVIQDPPWKIGFYERMTPFFECVRVCKVGGQIIYNAYWIPTSKYVELKEIYIRQDKPWTNTSIITVFEKIKDIQDGKQLEVDREW